jgi:hypothetical protein
MEPRTAILAQAEVSWDDRAGVHNGAPARMEDTSRSGACIRVKAQIHVGSRLKVKWHKEQFSGIAKYCRPEGDDYVLGIQRDTPESKVRTVPLSQSTTITIQTPSSAKIRDLPAKLDSKPQEFDTTRHEPEITPKATASGNPTGAHSTVPGRVSTLGADSHVRKFGLAGPAKQDGLQTQEPSLRQERTDMLDKLLHLKSGSHPQVALDGNANGTRVPANSTPTENVPAIKPARTAKDKFAAASQVDLLSLEDIYLAAGIMSLRLGHGINRVLAMLNSNHMRGMSDDVKRASILMALESAGVSLDELVQDAAQRLAAIHAFESGQQKYLEEFESTKAQENVQIQAEIERVTKHCLERIKRNLNEVASAKEAFRDWQTMKEKEIQQIAEAASICKKQPVSEPPSEPVPALEAAGVPSKP